MTEADIARLCADIQVGWNSQAWMAKARQARIAGASQRLQKAHIEGIGEHQMSVDPFIFHQWGQLHGYQVWNDPAFRKKMMQDNPELKVANKPRKGNRVGYGD